MGNALTPVPPPSGSAVSSSPPWRQGLNSITFEDAINNEAEDWMLDGSRLWVVSHSGGSRYHVRADVVQFQGSMVIFSRINVQGATRVVMAVHAPTFIYELVDWKPQKPQRPAGFTPREIRK